MWELTKDMNTCNLTQ